MRIERKAGLERSWCGQTPARSRKLRRNGRIGSGGLRRDRQFQG